MKNFKYKILAVPFGVMTTMMLMTSAFAATPEGEIKPAVETVETTNYSQLVANGLELKLDSNNDTERRNALNETFDIQLTEYDVWNNREGQPYTSRKVMEEQGFYAVNANRQDLIQYGIRTNDWQPYMAFEAKDAPAYYEVVNGKYEYSKVYYASKFLSHQSHGYLALTYPDIYKKELAEIIANFKAAPGYTPIVAGLNHTEDLAKANDVEQADKDYYESKYNHVDVILKGIFPTEKASTNSAN